MFAAQTIVHFVGIVLFLLGVTFGVMAIVLGMSANRKKRVCTRRTTGRVSDVRETAIRASVGQPSMYAWVPEFTYEANGHTFTKRSAYGDHKGRFSVGQKVTVYYDPADPDVYYVAEEKVSKLQGIFAAIGVTMLIAGGVVLAVWLGWVR